MAAKACTTLAVAGLIVAGTILVPAGARASGMRPLKEASREASRHAERELIARALDRTHWNRKRTARELQISYKALLYKLKQLGLSDQESE